MIAVLILLLAPARADASARLDEVNRALAAGDLAAAEAGYRDLLAHGNTSGDIWYNLGNVLYRQDKDAEAVLAWRNAAARLPRDPDVQANLDFARRSMRDGLVASEPRPWFAPWQAALTPDEGVWIGALLAGTGVLSIALRRRCPPWPLLPAGAVGATAGALLLAGALAAEAEPAVAVVLAHEATATSDLGGGVALFTLHAGAEVQVAEAAAGRVLVVLSDGRRGWLPDAAVGIVDPARPAPML